MSRRSKHRASAQWLQDLLKQAPAEIRVQMEREPTLEELASLCATLTEIADDTVRTVARLRYIEGIPAESISKRLGLTLDETMDHLARAVAAVRRKRFSAEDGDTHSLH